LFSKIAKHQCSSENNIQSISENNSEIVAFDINNHSFLFDRSYIKRNSGNEIFQFVFEISYSFGFIDEQSNNRVLYYIIIPMSFIVFILSILIIILLMKSTRKIKHGRFYPSHCRKTQDSSSVHGFSHTYTNNIMYRTNNKLFVDRKNQQHVFPIKSELCIRRITTNPVYSTVSSQSLPSLVLPSPPIISSQPLSVHRLYKSYV